MSQQPAARSLLTAADWLVLSQGQETGPFSVEQLAARVAAGNLAAVDLVRRGDGNWVVARDVQFLAACLAKAPAQATQGASSVLGRVRGVLLSKEALVIGGSLLLGLLWFAVVWVTAQFPNGHSSSQKSTRPSGDPPLQIMRPGGDPEDEFRQHFGDPTKKLQPDVRRR